MAGQLTGRFVTILAVMLVSGCQAISGLDGAAVPTTALAAQPMPVNLLAPLRGGLVARSAVGDLSRADRTIALESEYKALEYTAPGDLVTWSGGGVAGQVVSSQPYRVGSQDCRQYAHTLAARGREPQTMRGTACRNSDGSWELLA